MLRGLAIWLWFERCALLFQTFCTESCINDVTTGLAFSSEYINLAYNTNLEVLSLSQWTPSTIRRDCLAIVNQISSDRFHMLNISLVDRLEEDIGEGGLALALDGRRRQLAAIDEHFARKLVNSKWLTLGAPSAFRNNIKDYFPLNAARGSLRVVSVRQMQRLPAMANTGSNMDI